VEVTIGTIYYAIRLVKASALHHGDDIHTMPSRVDDPDKKLGQDCFIVRDANGQALAYVYFEEEPGRRSADPRRVRIAANIANLPVFPLSAERPQPRREGPRRHSRRDGR
jgi:hypothetical protein